MRESPSLWRWLIIFLLGLVTAFASTASSATSNPIKIMPLGDSITYGSSSTGTVGYRRLLYQLLIGVGYDVDFVGNKTNGSPEDFDLDHEGHPAGGEDRDNLCNAGHRIRPG